MIFHIAICSPDGALRSRLEHQCMEFFARREDACIVEQLQSPEALLQQDAAGLRYELYLIELAAVARPEGLTAAAELRRRGRRAPLAFVARTPAHAYSAYRVDAMQYLLQPVHQPEVSALLKRAVEPEYGPTLTVTTADGVRALTYAEIEYLECTHHIVHFHLTTGEDVASLSLRVPFSAVAQPLLAPLLCGQSGSSTAAVPRRGTDAQRGAHPHPPRAGSRRPGGFLHPGRVKSKKVAAHSCSDFFA